jgi:hypothetical protein
MRKIVIISLLILNSAFLIGQNTYYDAKYLKRFLNNDTLSSQNNRDNFIKNELNKEIKNLDTNDPNYNFKKKEANAKLSEINKNESDSIFSILKNYFPIKEDFSEDNIMQVFNENNFFRSITYAGKTRNYSPLNAVNLSSFNKLSGVDITTVADGFAKFIVKRTKQELSTAFFEQFKDDLNDDKYKNLKLIFPQTFRTLSAIDNEIYMFDLYIQTLRESFEKDLRTLPANLPSLIDYNSAYFEQRKELKAELKTAFYIAQSIQDNQHPGDMIEKYDVDELYDVPNMRAAFQTLKLFSKSLKSNNDSSYWVSEKEIKTLCKDSTLLNLYLGLVLQQAKKDSINFVFGGVPIKLADVINSSHNDKIKIEKYRSYISTISSKAQSIDKKIIGLKKEKNDSLLLENYYAVISTSIDLMKYAIQIDKLPGLETANLEKSSLLYFELAQTTSDIVIDVHRRNYSSAIVNVSYIAQSIDTLFHFNHNCKIRKLKHEFDSLNDTCLGITKKYSYANLLQNIKIKNPELKKPSELIELACKDTFIADIDLSDAYKIATKIVADNNYIIRIKNDYLKSIADYDNSVKNYENFLSKHKDTLYSDVAQKLLKYGSFMAVIANAKNSDQVNNAIEAIALPSGSSRIKRESAFNVSINAYCGFYGGKNIAGDWSAGLTAPVGIAVSWGICRHSSLSLFFSIIDLGAPVAFRFSNSSDSVPAIKLADIISPGLFLSWGIPKCPVSVNAGLQMTPALNSVSTKVNTFGTKSLRVTIGACVDLPLLNLYNKSK